MEIKFRKVLDIIKKIILIYLLIGLFGCNTYENNYKLKVYYLNGDVEVIQRTDEFSNKGNFRFIFNEGCLSSYEDGRQIVCGIRRYELISAKWNDVK